MPALLAPVLLALAAGAGPPPSGPSDAGPVFPGKEWSTCAPAEAGMERSRLEAFQSFVGGRGCVVRHGQLVHAWGDPARRGDVASAAKPWYTHFLLLAIGEKRLPGLDAPVDAFEPRLDSLNAPGFKDRKIRWRDLACQTSAYGVREPPGGAYDYSDYNMALFFDTLFLKVYGSSLEKVDEQVLRPRLSDIIECQDRPTFLAFGTGDRPGRLAVSPRDFARFGLLYLRGGSWKGRRVLSREQVALVTASPLPGAFPRTGGEQAEMIAGQRSIGGGNNQTDHLGSYSFAWWTNGADRSGERHWPDAPADAFGAFGHGGMRALVVMPGLDLVASWNDSPNEGRAKENQALKLLRDAVAPTK